MENAIQVLRQELEILDQKLFDEVKGLNRDEFTKKCCDDPDWAIKVFRIYADFKEKYDQLGKFEHFSMVVKKFAECMSAEITPELKCVYILEMSNQTVKIGCTKNFKQRMRSVITGSGLGVVNWCHSDYIPARKAYYIEGACHKAFAQNRIEGEFFNIAFEVAASELMKHTAIKETMYEN